MNVRFVIAAERELDDAVAYYDAQRQGLGREFAEAVAHGVARIAERPYAWHSLGPRTRRYRLDRFPYGLVYFIHADHVAIVAVAHHSRHPDFWKGRSVTTQEGET